MCLLVVNSIVSYVSSRAIHCKTIGGLPIISSVHAVEKEKKHGKFKFYEMTLGLTTGYSQVRIQFVKDVAVLWIQSLAQSRVLHNSILAERSDLSDVDSLYHESSG